MYIYIDVMICHGVVAKRFVAIQRTVFKVLLYVIVEKYHQNVTNKPYIFCTIDMVELKSHNAHKP